MQEEQHPSGCLTSHAQLGMCSVRLCSKDVPRSLLPCPAAHLHVGALLLSAGSKGKCFVRLGFPSHRHLCLGRLEKNACLSEGLKFLLTTVTT